MSRLINVPGFSIDKNGKVRKTPVRPRDASHAIAMRKSKRTRVVRKGAVR